MRQLRDNVGERCLSGAGRPGENYRRQAICLDRAAQKFSRPKNVCLPDELIERPWPHPRSEWSVAVDLGKIDIFRFTKQIGHQQKYGVTEFFASDFELSAAPERA